MTAADKKNLEALRLAKSEAYRTLHAHPSPENKRAYMEACKIYARLRYQTDPEFRASRARSNAKVYVRKKIGTVSYNDDVQPRSMLDQEIEVISDFQDKKNAAQRAFHANPTPESRAVFLSANAQYYKIRRHLDPAFKQARDEANTRSKLKKTCDS